MKHSKSLVLVTAGLVAGLVLGGMGLAAASPSTVGGGAAGKTGAVGACVRMGQAIRGSGARLVDVLAGLTGLSAADIRSKRTAGESIADIARAEGVDPGDIVDKALELRASVLEQKVKDETITQAQADAAYAQMKERLAERIESTATAGPSWGGRGAGRCTRRGASGGGAAYCGPCPNAAQVQ
ncbi:MAG: hypothetical protein N3B11_02265 [Coriobacteriia bacterium]|nr:hypothetical protein [Coriobacteriia bacterium]